VKYLAVVATTSKLFRTVVMPYTFYESMSKSTYHNGCARKMRAFIGGVLVNLTGTPNERHDGLLRVNINKEYT
jgi:hypothetical protein